MNLLRLLTASLMTISMVGCCTNRCAMNSSCDPCGGICDQECTAPRIWPFSRCSKFRWNSTVCDCNDCGGTSGCGCGGGNTCGAPMMNSMPSSGGCGCSGTDPFSGMTPSTNMYPGSSPSLNSTPTAIPPVPPAGGNSIPIPSPTTLDNLNLNNGTTFMNSPNSTSGPTMVSYEEFQRLPGTITSGPGAVQNASATIAVQQVASNPTPAIAPLPPPPLPPAPAPAPTPALAPAPSNTAKKFYNPAQTRQAVWNPTKAY